METTPVTSGGRHRSRRKVLSSQNSPCTSTPSTSRTESFTRRRREDSENEDYPFLNTQITPKIGEVYWDYEESPSVREALRKKLAESDSPISSEKRPPIHEMVTPTLKLRPTNILKPNNEDNPEGLAILEDMRKLSELMNNESTDDTTNDEDENEEDNDETLDKSDQSKSPKRENKTFSSDEDSFLIAASQMAETVLSAPNVTHQANRPVPTIKTPVNAKPTPAVSESRPEPPLFDDDDDFWMSQVSMPETKTANPTRVTNKPVPAVVQQKTSSAIVKPRTVAANSTIKPAAKTSLPYGESLDSSATFKRFKSSDSVSMGVRGRNTAGQNSSLQTLKSWQRVNTSPQAATGSGMPGGRKSVVSVKPKCTKEEIELKRQEALKKRRLRSHSQLGALVKN